MVWTISSIFSIKIKFIKKKQAKLKSKDSNQ